MAILATFKGKAALPGPDNGYRIWSYRIEASPPGDIPANTRIALGLPTAAGVSDGSSSSARLSPLIGARKGRCGGCGVLTRRLTELGRRSAGRCSASTVPGCG